MCAESDDGCAERVSQVAADRHVDPLQLTEEQRERSKCHRLLALQRRQARQISLATAAVEQNKAKRYVCDGRVFLSCPFADKDKAKNLGARWDVDGKKWYLHRGQGLSEFAAWLNPQDKQALLDALAQKEELDLRLEALRRDWTACNNCSAREGCDISWVDKNWQSCPTCDLAKKKIQEFEKQVAVSLSLPQVKATVITHFLIANLTAMPTVSRQQVLQDVKTLFFRTCCPVLRWPVPTGQGAVPGYQTIKDLGNPSKAAEMAALFQPESFLEKFIAVRDNISNVLQDEGDWKSTAELLSRIHLPPSERNISEEYKAKVLVRVAELYLEDNALAESESLIGHANAMINQAEFTNISVKYAFFKLRAHLCELKAHLLFEVEGTPQRKFNEAARDYYKLSEVVGVLQEAANSDPLVDEQRKSALTKAAVCAILAPAGPLRSDTVAMLMEDERTHKIAPFNLLRTIHLEQIVQESDIQKLEELLLPHQKALSGDSLTALQKLMNVHNSLVEKRAKEEAFLVSGRRRGHVKVWDAERGFGFISPISSVKIYCLQDVFCHFTKIKDGNMLREGDLVEYENKSDDPKGPAAVCVTGGHWKDGDDTQTVRKRKRVDVEPHESPHQHHAPNGLDGKGFWVLAEIFEGLKSFGCFSCTNMKCGKMWTSAHTTRNPTNPGSWFRQGCKNCDTNIYPCCLWYNNPEYQEYNRAVRSEGEQHDTTRCEAGRHGVCSVCARLK
jgi:cold shock CspA family protein